MTGSDRKYIIRKQGCYYRPNERGYTTSAIQAGRYTRDEAEKITHPNGKDGPRDGMSVIHEDELLGIDEDWTAYSALLADRRDPAVIAALPEVQALIAAAEARGMERAAARARVYASNYEQSSDGRNTFILLAEWADAEAAAILARAADMQKDAAK